MSASRLPVSLILTLGIRPFCQNELVNKIAMKSMMLPTFGMGAIAPAMLAEQTHRRTVNPTNRRREVPLSMRESPVDGLVG
jgi:hypothetical protein